MVDQRKNTARKWWWLVAVGLLLGVAAGYVLGQSAGRNVSTSQILVTGAGGIDASLDPALTSNQYATARMPTYAALAGTSAVGNRATEALGLEEGGLSGAITATVGTIDATLIDLAVTGPSPQAAQDRNVAVTEALQAVIVESENVAGQPPRVALQVISPANLPDAAALGRSTILIIGAIIGLVLGAVASTVLTRRDRKDRERRGAFESDLSSRGQPIGRSTANGGPSAGRPAPSVPPRRPAPTGDGYSGRERP